MPGSLGRSPDRWVQGDVPPCSGFPGGRQPLGGALIGGCREMSLLARGSQAADSPWAESAERGPSLLWVPRGETPWAGYRGSALIGTGQSPGPRQSPQLRKAKRVVIVGYNRPAFLSPHAPVSFFSLPSSLSAASGATDRRMGRSHPALGLRGCGNALGRTVG